MRLQPICACLWQQPRQVRAWQQQIRAASRAKERVLENPQKYLPAGARWRRVQRRDAQRLNQRVHQALRQPGAQLLHTGAAGALKSLPLPPARAQQQRNFFRPAPVAVAQDAGEGVERAGPVGHHQSFAIRELQGQRHAQQHAVGIDANPSHQRQRLGIRTDEDMLAVVQNCIAAVWHAYFDSSGAAAQCAGGLKHRYTMPRPRGADGCGHTGPARADNRDFQSHPKACTFQASQNLRTGVRRTRWCNT